MLFEEWTLNLPAVKINSPVMTHLYQAIELLYFSATKTKSARNMEVAYRKTATDQK